jgi:hypothetical protein
MGPKMSAPVKSVIESVTGMKNLCSCEIGHRHALPR